MDTLAPRLRAARPPRDLHGRITLTRLAARLRGLAPPSVAVGRYLLERRIGSGSTGVVFSAWDPALRRRVAVKLVEHGWTRARHHEARALARLSHPNIVQVLDVGTFALRTAAPNSDQITHGAYIVTELVVGETLRAWARRGQPWPALLRAFECAAVGLAAAHAVGIVHRDFKPDNVLIDADGRTRVLDFGLACGDGDASAVAGTPAYMAPEQLRGAPATASVDQYAWAVALYEALHGHRPFAGEASADLIANGEPPSPETDGHARRAPAHVHAALRRALQPDPRQRFSCMQTLIVALRPTRGPRRRRWFGLAAAVAVLATVATPTRSVDALPANPRPVLAAHNPGWEVHALAAARLRDGDFATAHDLAVQAGAIAAAINEPQLAASACRVEVSTTAATHSAEDASGRAQACYDAATERGADEHAARLAATLASTFAASGERPRAHRWLNHAQAAFDRTQGPPALAAELHRRRGEVAYFGGDTGEAVRELRVAVDLTDLAYAAGHRNRGKLRVALGAALSSQGRREEALTVNVAAVRELEAALGPAHPDLVVALVNLSAYLIDTEPHQAARLLVRAEEIAQASGLSGREMQTLHNNLGTALDRLGDPHGARARYVLALAEYPANGRSEDAVAGLLHLNLGHVLLQVGDPESAIDHLEHSIEVLRVSANLGDERGRLVRTLATLCDAYVALGWLNEARGALARADAVDGRLSPASRADREAARARLASRPGPGR